MAELKLSKNVRWFILIVTAAIILFPTQFAMPKEAVADVAGKSCTENADCP